jgi:hypothetical protein
MLPREAEPHKDDRNQTHPCTALPQDILQVIQQSGAPASRAQRHAVHCRVPDRNGPAIRAEQTADSMADPPCQRPAITGVRDRPHQPAKQHCTISHCASSRIASYPGDADHAPPRHTQAPLRARCHRSGAEHHGRRWTCRALTSDLTGWSRNRPRRPVRQEASPQHQLPPPITGDTAAMASGKTGRRSPRSRPPSQSRPHPPMPPPPSRTTLSPPQSRVSESGS